MQELNCLSNLQSDICMQYVHVFDTKQIYGNKIQKKTLSSSLHWSAEHDTQGVQI